MRVVVRKAYDPNEPRVPKGQPGGGEWTDGGRAKLKPGDSHPMGYPPSTAEDREAVNSRGHGKVPPASWGLWVNPDPNGKHQAKWYDSRGKQQILYHSDHVAEAAEHKFETINLFRRVLPKIRRGLRQDLGLDDADKRRVAAAIVAIIDSTGMRVGSEEIASREGDPTFGASSLRKEHVSVKGDVVRFHFVGKHHKEHEREIRDAELARVVSHLLRLPGDRLFQYHTRPPEGELVPLDEAKVNAYLKQHGEGVSAKQFRTYHATRMAAELLAKAGPPPDEKTAKRTIAGVVSQVAEFLGNTPTVCRSSYINGAVIDAYAKGVLVARQFKGVGTGLSEDELWFHRLLDHVEGLLKQGKVNDADPFPEGVSKAATVVRRQKPKAKITEEKLRHLDDRLTQEMARCHAQYDQARSDLASHSEKMEGEEKGLLAKAKALEPKVDAVLHGESGLDQAAARALMEYLQVLARLTKVRQAKRLAHGATVPPGEQALGKPLGRPPLQAQP